MAKLAHEVTIIYEKGDQYAIPTLYELIQTFEEKNFDLVEVIESSKNTLLLHIKETPYEQREHRSTINKQL